MNAVRTSLKASDLPDSLAAIRAQIERDVPLGAGGTHKEIAYGTPGAKLIGNMVESVTKVFSGDIGKAQTKAMSQLGTLGSGK